MVGRLALLIISWVCDLEQSPLLLTHLYHYNYSKPHRIPVIIKWYDTWTVLSRVSIYDPSLNKLVTVRVVIMYLGSFNLPITKRE